MPIGLREMDRLPVDPLNVLMQILPRFEMRLQHKSITLEPVVERSIPEIIADPG